MHKIFQWFFQSAKHYVENQRRPALNETCEHPSTFNATFLKYSNSNVNCLQSGIGSDSMYHKISFTFHDWIQFKLRISKLQVGFIWFLSYPVCTFWKWLKNNLALSQWLPNKLGHYHLLMFCMCFMRMKEYQHPFGEYFDFTKKRIILHFFRRIEISDPPFFRLFPQSN